MPSSPSEASVQHAAEVLSVSRDTGLRLARVAGDYLQQRRQFLKDCPTGANAILVEQGKRHLEARVAENRKRIKLVG